MKYWESATIFSLTPTNFSSKAIVVIKWAGITIYTAAILALWITAMVTWPGWENSYFRWLFLIWPRVTKLTIIFFLTINLLNTGVTIYAICKIFITVR